MTLCSDIEYGLNFMTLMKTHCLQIHSVIMIIIDNMFTYLHDNDSKYDIYHKVHEDNAYHISRILHTKHKNIVNLSVFQADK